MKKTLKITGKVLGIALNIILCLVIVVNLYMIAARTITGKSNPTLFGFCFAVVLTDSMKGTEQDSFAGNAMVFTMAQDEYFKNDIIMIQADGYSYTHRIIEVTPEGFITKGDFNNTADSVPVKQENIIGKVFLSMNNVGAGVKWLSSGTGRMVIIIALALILFLPSFLSGNKKTEENAPEGAADTTAQNTDTAADPDSEKAKLMEQIAEAKRQLADKENNTKNEDK